MTFAERVLNALKEDDMRKAMDICTEKVTAEILEAKGGKSELDRRKAAKELFKAAKKLGHVEHTLSCWYVGEYQLLSDGRYVIRLTDHIPELPVLAEGAFMPSFEKLWVEAAAPRKLTDEEVKDIHVKATIHGSGTAEDMSTFYACEDEHVSYLYLSRIIRVLGNKDISIGFSVDKHNCCLCISSPYGKAMLAPLMKPKKVETTTTEGSAA